MGGFELGDFYKSNDHRLKSDRHRYEYICAIIKAEDSVKFYAFDADLKKRGLVDGEIIDGISKLNLDDLESKVTLVF